MIDDGASNARNFLARVRDHYVDQLLLFLAEQRRISIRGESEVKVQHEPDARIFRSMTIADFARNDGEPELVQFTPQRMLRFDAIVTTLGETSLSFESLRWDDVIIEHNGTFDAEQVLGGWFERWFDPDDRRYTAGSDLGNVIHSLLIEPQIVRVDFGSAAPDSLWQLLNLLVKAGATEIRISAPVPELEEPPGLDA